jgi:putative ABC transport system permease protein
MENLFGIPMDTVMLYLLGASILLIAGIVILAVRKPLFARLALRNIPRRRAQSVLIVLGLMLATLLITAAFGTGDTMTYSMRQAFTAALGGTDIQVERVNPIISFGGPPDFNRPAPTFSETVYTDLRASLANDDRIDGWSRSLTQFGPVINVTRRQSSGQTFISGIGPDYRDTLGDLPVAGGGSFDVSSLGPDEIVIDEAAADKLNAAVGDTLRILSGGREADLRLSQIVQNASVTNQFPTVFVSLDRMREVYNAPNGITQVNISLKGGNLDGIKYSKEMAAELRKLVDTKVYTVNEAKQDALNIANLIGSLFTTLFIFAALFSIAAGVLLIFLIFTMLAAERKSEMGMARAVGTQRGHLTQMFIFEGMAYDLVAAAVGAALGVGVGFVLVGAVSGVLGTFGFRITPHVEVRSVVVAYCLGMLITFLTVAISAWRVSRLNIVSAIRDIPDLPHAPLKLSQQVAEPFNRLAKGQPLGCIGAAFSLLASLFRSGPVTGTLGVLLFILGWSLESAFLFHLGASLTIIAIGMTIRWLLGFRGVRRMRRDRIAYTVSGLLLLIYWLLPVDTLHDWIGAPEFGQDNFTTLLFVGGIMTVLASVWVIMYNADILLNAIGFLLGRAGRLRPVLKTAIAYPVANLFRTGMAIAMFALIMFVLILLSVLTSLNQQIGPTDPKVTGGFDIEAKVSFTNPIPDMRERIAQTPELRDLFVATGGQTLFPLEVRQVGAKPPVVPLGADIFLQQPGLREGFYYYNTRFIDEQFIDATRFEMSVRARGYNPDREVWEAIANDPTLVVVDALPVVLGAAGGTGGFGPPLFTVTGASLENPVMDPIEIEMRAPGVPNAPVTRVKIIGVLNRFANFYTGLYANRELSPQVTGRLFPGEIPTSAYFFSVKDQPGVTRDEAIDRARRALGSTFLENGLEPLVIADAIRNSLAVSNGLNGLLQGFLALGLLVGVAALGVISTRAVVERRQQIGVLRAIGYQRHMVAESFLLEASFISLTGILLGVALGLAMSYSIVEYARRQTPQLEFSIPWLQILVIVAIAYVVSLITTILPSRAASRIYPAEALRHSG